MDTAGRRGLALAHGTFSKSFAASSDPDMQVDALTGKNREVMAMELRVLEREAKNEELVTRLQHVQQDLSRQRAATAAFQKQALEACQLSEEWAEKWRRMQASRKIRRARHQQILSRCADMLCQRRGNECVLRQVLGWRHVARRSRLEKLAHYQGESLEEAERRIEEVEQQLAAMEIAEQARNEVQRTHDAAKQARIMELEDQLDAFTKDRREQEQQQKAAIMRIMELEAGADACKSEITMLSGQITSLNAQVAEHQRSTDCLQKDLKAKSDALEHSQDALAALRVVMKQEITKLDENVKAKDEEIAKMHADVAALQAASKANDGRMNAENAVLCDEKKTDASTENITFSTEKAAKGRGPSSEDEWAADHESTQGFPDTLSRALWAKSCVSDCSTQLLSRQEDHLWVQLDSAIEHLHGQVEQLERELDGIAQLNGTVRNHVRELYEKGKSVSAIRNHYLLSSYHHLTLDHIRRLVEEIETEAKLNLEKKTQEAQCHQEAEALRQKHEAAKARIAELESKIDLLVKHQKEAEEVAEVHRQQRVQQMKSEQTATARMQREHDIRVKELHWELEDRQNKMNATQTRCEQLQNDLSVASERLQTQAKDLQTQATELQTCSARLKESDNIRASLGKLNDDLQERLRIYEHFYEQQLSLDGSKNSSFLSPVRLPFADSLEEGSTLQDSDQTPRQHGIEFSRRTPLESAGKEDVTKDLSLSLSLSEDGEDTSARKEDTETSRHTSPISAADLPTHQACTDLPPSRTPPPRPKINTGNVIAY